MRIRVEVTSAPKSGKLTIRFLGRIRGILTHWSKRGNLACPGPSECRTHDQSTWKGYAPAQVYQHDTELWLPTVFECTLNMRQIVGNDNLCGKAYDVFRMKTRWGRQQVGCQELTLYQGINVPDEFDVEPVVNKIYKTNRIAWDVDPEPYFALFGEPVQDLPPVRAAPPPELPKAVEARSALEEFRKLSSESTRRNGKTVDESAAER